MKVPTLQTWVNNRLGGWGSYYTKIGVVILVVLILLALVLCCCIPLIRSFASKGVDRAMGFQAVMMTDIEDDALDHVRIEEGEVLPDEVLIETQQLGMDDIMDIHDHERGDVWDPEKRHFLLDED